MDIVEARTLLGISEYAETEEIQLAQDRIIDIAIKSGDVDILRRSARAVAALFVAGGHYSQEEADRYVARMDAFYDTQVSSIDQRTRHIQDLSAAIATLGLPSASSEDESLDEAVARRLGEDLQYQAALAHVAERQATKVARKQRRAELLHNVIHIITFRR